MRLICSGISFHETTLDQREPLAFGPDRRQRLLCAMRQCPQVHEAMVLCTCNRTEIYAYCEGEFNFDTFLVSLIGDLNAEAADIWSRLHHTREDIDAVRHLFTVAAGLDSQMIGENQIIRQFKTAYSDAIEAATARFFFHRLMHSTFRVSKAVRTQTDINCGAVSISAAAVELAKTKITLPGASAVLIGAGENATLIAEYLVKAGIGTLTIASRTLETATELAVHLKTGTPATLDQLPQLLAEADLVLCSTAAETPIITAEDHGYLLTQRSKPIVMIDVAVPRDVEAAVGDMDAVQLYNIEDLDAQVQANIAQRSTHIPQAKAIIDEHVDRFDEWLKSLNVTDVVKSLIEEYQTMARDEANRYSGLFPDLNPEELQKFAESLASKFLHGPVTYLKQSSADDVTSEQLQAMDAVRKMLLDASRKRGGQ
ncbi:MAG: glutamyl-tRNA reductase [Planctomycetota bacterium]|jgi:glutamyl-tRNA reductase